jgi:hypothetical protein
MAELSLQDVVKKTSPTKLAVRLMSLDATERCQRIGEYHQQVGTVPTTKDGVIATLEGEYSKEDGRISLSYTVKAEATEGSINGVWFAIINGDEKTGDALVCSIANTSIPSPGSEMSGGTFYKVIDPAGLASAVTLHLGVTPKDGNTVMFQKSLPIL